MLQIKFFTNCDFSQKDEFKNIFNQAVIEDLDFANLMINLDEWQEIFSNSEKFENFSKNYFLIFYLGKIIWFLGFRRDFPFRKRFYNNFSIGPIYIIPDFRGKWLAKKSLQIFEKNFTNSKSNIILWVNSLNLTAINLYKSCGFEYVGVYKNYIFHNEKYFDLVLMQKIFIK